MSISEKTRKQLAFFGVTPENAAQTRVAIFSQIHEIVFFGKGGYTWYDVYNMPIWLRKFTHSQIANYYQEEKTQVENAKNGDKGQKTMVNSDGTVNTPDFLKASKQYKKPASYK